MESYNGTSWTEVNNVTTAVAWMNSFGTNTAAMLVGGDTGGAVTTVNSQTWNGTSWAEGNNLPGGVLGNTGTGSTAAGLNLGAEASPYRACQTYDGTSWTEVNNTNSQHGYASCFGTQASAVVAGSNSPGTTAVSESWDGTSWTETADMATARYGTAAFGLGSAGVVTGGAATLTTTEEWTNPVYAIKTVTVS